jgi:plastocyanin
MFLNRWNLRLAPLLPTAVLLLAGFAGASSSAAGGGEPSTAARPAKKVETIVIRQLKYLPERLVVNVGQTVEWKNADIVPHTATGVNAKTFDSGVIATGKSWRFTAKKKGTYDYFCTLHPNMKATLVVR